MTDQPSQHADAVADVGTMRLHYTGRDCADQTTCQRMHFNEFHEELEAVLNDGSPHE
jgi:hypothetical protein